jgi:hypothetical protein
MSLRKYLTSLLIVVAALSLVCSFLPFVTRSHVASGAVMEESWKHDFVLSAGGNRYYQIDPELKSELERTIAFKGLGSVRVASAQIAITPKEVSWSEGKNKSRSAPGGEMSSSVRWEAAADAPDGAKGQVNVEFPGFDPKFHSGGRQFTDGKWVFREVTVYRSGMSLALGRFLFGMATGAPLAVVAHSIWLLFLFPRIKRARAAADVPPAEAPLPRVFSANPVSEGQAWCLTLLITGLVASVIAAMSMFDGYMSTVLLWVIVCMLGAGVIIGLLIVWGLNRSVVTVKIDAENFAYTKGRGVPRWVAAPWRELRAVVPKVRKVKNSQIEWLEVTYADGTTRKIHSGKVADYPALRDMSVELFAHHHPPASGEGA